ncbi:MAG: Hsp20/alpha crystallin family protein [Patescibacteria group bacterium]
MSKQKRSFFERLTGTVRMDDEAEVKPVKKSSDESSSWVDEESDKDAELTVDVYQTADMIVVKAMIAGVRPEDLDVSITRDLVTIRGTREEERTANDDDFFVRELYWGSFSRAIQLPEEIDVDEAEAVEKHGLLILKLPKLDKKRQSKLKVKTV